MTATRYEVHRNHSEFIEMKEYPRGDWVSYEDYSDLKIKYDELVKVVDYLWRKV